MLIWSCLFVLRRRIYRWALQRVLAKEKFVSDFENTYGYEKEVITEITKLPTHYIAAMPDAVQEEIGQKVIAALTEHGECTP